MTILFDAHQNVNVLDTDPTVLDRQYAAESSPFADEFQADGPTPVELLEEWVSDDDEDRAEAPRYEVRPARPSVSCRTIRWVVYDRMEDRNVSYCDHRHDAEDDCEVFNFGDEGEWWATLPTEPDLDEWRYTLAIAGSFPSASDAWASEGRARLKATGSTRGDLNGNDCSE